MLKRNRTFWPLALLMALLLVFMGSTAFARGGGRGGGGGGRGGGGGGRGGGGGARGGRGGRGSPGGRGGGQGSSAKAKEDQKLQRREERAKRVALARMEYAKRERQRLWDAEDAAETAGTLRRVMDGATE